MSGFFKIIGAVVGGVIGFMIGGPPGAWIGASIGFTAGSLVDAMTAKTPGIPRQLLDITVNTIGAPVPDLLGTGRITGLFLCYGLEHKEAQSAGGKGGGSGQTTGYKYYMSWGVAIVKGKVDALLAVYADDEVPCWGGQRHDPSGHPENILYCPSSGGVETITMKDYGKARFYFGTDDQEPDPVLAKIIGDATLNSPLRGLCYCVFDDCLIGSSNRCPSMHFVVAKFPNISGLPSPIIQTWNYNAAHAMWYILNVLNGLPISWLCTDDFIAVANTLLEEERGISILFDQQQSALTYLQTILQHIDGVIRYGSDGMFHPKLMRKDYDIASLPVVDEKVYLDKPTFQRPGWIDTVNEIIVQYSYLYNVVGAPTTSTIQPDSADTFLQEGNPTINSGNAPVLTVGVGGVGAARALLKLDFSGGIIPAGSIIQSAQLGIYCSPLIGTMVGRTYWAYRLTQTAWVQGTGVSGSGADWNTYNGHSSWEDPGGDYSEEDGASFVISEEGWFTFDVTNQILYALENTGSVAHFLIKDGDEGNETGAVMSAEFPGYKAAPTTPLTFPYLQITYNPPIG